MPVNYVSKEAARSLWAGRLLTDFCLSREDSGWQITVRRIDGTAAILRAGNSDAGTSETIFQTADSALVALLEVGFDIYASGLGYWRPDPIIAEREHAKMRALLRLAIRSRR